jgi:hypothetical protein
MSSERLEEKKCAILPSEAAEERYFDGNSSVKMKVNGKFNLWETSYTMMMYVNFEGNSDLMGLCSLGRWPEGKGPFIHFMLRDKQLFHSHFGQTCMCPLKLTKKTWFHVAFTYNHVLRMHYIYINGKMSHEQKAKELKAPDPKNFNDEWFKKSSSAYLGQCVFMGHGNMKPYFQGKMVNAQLFVNTVFTERELTDMITDCKSPSVHPSLKELTESIGNNDGDNGKSKKRNLEHVSSSSVTTTQPAKNVRVKRRYLSSLGVLTKKFVALLKQSNDYNIDLNKAAKMLCVRICCSIDFGARSARTSLSLSLSLTHHT